MDEGEPGRRLAVDADRREMHDPPDAGTFAGRKQRRDAVGMDAAGRVGRRILQHPGAIDDRVDPGETGTPILGPGRARDIERPPDRKRLAASRPPRIAGERTNLMPRLEKPGDHRRADQPGRPDDQNPHREHNAAVLQKGGISIFPVAFVSRFNCTIRRPIVTAGNFAKFLGYVWRLGRRGGGKNQELNAANPMSYRRFQRVAGCRFTVEISKPLRPVQPGIMSACPNWPRIGPRWQPYAEAGRRAAGGTCGCSDDMRAKHALLLLSFLFALLPSVASPPRPAWTSRI